MKKTESYFIPHCDNEYCDLGSFQYICPHCNESTIDYDVWWEEEKIWKGNPHSFKCEKCGKLLIVEWKKYAYWVS